MAQLARRAQPLLARKRRGLGPSVPLRWQRALWAYAFLAVPLAFFLSIRIWPAVQAFNLSVHEWNIVGEAQPYVGAANFRELAADPRFARALLNTLQYTVVGVPLQLALGLALAMLLEQVRWLRGLLRAVYFVPYVTPVVAAAWVWQWLYSPNFGAVNGVLDLLGLPPQPFLNSPEQALYAVVAMVVWQNLGFQVVIFLAGLQSIPRVYYEAAGMDGAGPWRLFRHITLPLLNPTIVFSVVIGTLQYLQLFAQVVNLNFLDQGGPLDSTLTVALYIYQVAFQRFRMGQAAAATVVLFAVMMAVALLQLRFLSRRVEY
ncbi:sugar ABC transporter permease [Carboxydochorda subterranea]|uniref:Sugar ABC transporter permease n=1 Tax=Carboxydichorda subterranea TaxID=3109565 RepID=A0ABZ1BTQ1_9FIRM|nr:sugar ABC transporter permease [Limnochorda sp. L945t]WRP16028.1 sugar ABC transporter permease [Limnochorda sp. L945t]